MSNEIKTVEVLRDNFAEMVGSNFHALLKNSHDTGEPISFSQAKDALTKDEKAIKQQIATVHTFTLPTMLHLHQRSENCC